MTKKIKLIISVIISIIILFSANNTYASTISTDINSIDEAKYPGIKSRIQTLKAKYPSWNFQIEYTGLDFSEVIINECQGHGKSPINLSPANNSNYSGMWICPVCGSKLYDSGNWYCASEEAVRYMMDVRNSINENDIFQFLDLSSVGDSSVAITKSTDMKISSDMLEIVPSVDLNSIKQKYPNSSIKDSNGNEITSGNIATGNKIIIDNNTYTIIKKGDVNKDGLVNIVDVVSLLNYQTGKNTYDEESKNAGKVQSTSEISIVDIVSVLNSITGKNAITLQVDTGEVVNVMDSINLMTKNISYLDDECKQIIISSANKYKINPLYLVARIYQEQGKGTSPLANGSGYNGQYAGVFNLFNIGATGNSKEKVILNGLSCASSKGWTSKAKSIEGGAEIIANSYINKKQNTLYYQKFNVVGTTSLYNHQYMQNILAAQKEGSTLKNTYKSIDQDLTSTYLFTIPVYENMPKEVSKRPNTNVENKVNYVEKIVNVSSSLKVRSGASTSSAVISSLKNGDKVKVLKTTTEKINDHYWSLIICETTGSYGYVADEYLN